MRDRPDEFNPADDPTDDPSLTPLEPPPGHDRGVGAGTEPRPERPWDAVIASVRRRPREWAIGTVVALAAVLTGLALGGLLGGRDADVGQAGTSSSAVPSTPASEAPSPSPSQAPSPSMSVSQAPSVAPSVSLAASASPTATGTPNEGLGGQPGPSHQITGTWERMPDLPGGGDVLLSDALVLEPIGPTSEGDLVVIMWESANDGRPHVVAWDGAEDGWRTIATDDFVAGTDASFAQGSDGRLYGFAAMIDPSEEPWTAVRQGLANADEVYAGSTLDAGPDGRIYRPSTLPGTDAALWIFDPATGEQTESTTAAGLRIGCVVGTADGIVAMGADAVTTYDPAADAWGDEVIGTPGTLDCARSGVGPDGRIYGTADADVGPLIFAWRPGSPDWASVEPPPATEGFRPIFVTYGDALWAIAEDEVWRFDEIDG